jgi:hypothetical protein
MSKIGLFFLAPLLKGIYTNLKNKGDRYVCRLQVQQGFPNPVLSRCLVLWQLYGRFLEVSSRSMRVKTGNLPAASRCLVERTL